MNGLGLFTMTGNNTYTGGTNVQSGTLVTNTNFSNGSLNITGGVARVAAKTNSADPSGVSIVPSVTITGGTLDLTNNALVVDYTAGNSPFSTIRSQIIAGYASGTWNGTGINSSSAKPPSAPPIQPRSATPKHPTLGVGSFDGHTVDNTSVLVGYTLAGDANLDGKVNALDFNALASHFGVSSNGNWTQGDFNYDGTVSTSDFTALSQNFNAPLAAPALSALLRHARPRAGDARRDCAARPCRPQATTTLSDGLCREREKGQSTFGRSTCPRLGKTGDLILSVGRQRRRIFVHLLQPPIAQLARRGDVLRIVLHPFPGLAPHAPLSRASRASWASPAPEV